MFLKILRSIKEFFKHYYFSDLFDVEKQRFIIFKFSIFVDSERSALNFFGSVTEANRGVGRGKTYRPLPPGC